MQPRREFLKTCVAAVLAGPAAVAEVAAKLARPSTLLAIGPSIEAIPINPPMADLIALCEELDLPLWIEPDRLIAVDPAPSTDLLIRDEEQAD